MNGLKIINKNINEIKEYENNAKEHPDWQIEQIANSIQEKMTKEIAEAIQNNLDCAGIYVEVEARHMCMELRGIKARGGKTKTIYKTGCYLRGDNNCKE